MAVAGGADLIVAENVPGDYRTYLDLARWLSEEHGYRTTVSSGGAWEVGAPHRRERIMLVAARRLFEPRRINVVRQVAPTDLLPTPSVVDRAWGLTPKQWSVATARSTTTETGTARPSPRPWRAILRTRRFVSSKPGRT